MTLIILQSQIYYKKYTRFPTYNHPFNKAINKEMIANYLGNSFRSKLMRNDLKYYVHCFTRILIALMAGVNEEHV